jgi:alpha-L-rhamnosidase
MAQIATLLGHDADATQFDALATRIGDAFNSTFYDGAAGAYADNSAASYRQTSNILPLVFGIVPEDRRDLVLANLVKDVENRDNHLSTGALGTKYLLPTLTENGHADLAYKVATNPTYPGWGYWFEELGATTMWEEWGAKSRSLDHAFLGTVDDWLYQNVAGIEATAPGYTKIKIQPYWGGNVTNASAHVDSPLGNVSSAWTSTGGVFTLSVGVPVGATAMVYVPADKREHVTIPAGAAFDSLHDGYAAFTVGSGDYEFRSDAGSTPALDVEVTVDSRCVASKVVLTPTATNGEGVPVAVEFASAYGTKSFPAIASGKNAFHAFTTRLASMPAGDVTVTSSAVVAGETVSTEQVVPYSARGC